MTQENKELLLKDLSARLPYEVKVHAKYVDTDNEVEKVGVLSVIDYDGVSAFTCDDTNCYHYVDIHEVKPYLFPLSSMSEEQKEEFYKFFEEGITESANETRQWLRTKRADETIRPITIAYVMVHELVIEWLNKNHFDYRGLIPMGLAIDCTNLNIY